MQSFASNLIGSKVFIFQNNSIVGIISNFLVNPDNLNIELLELDIPPRIKKYLLTKDIRSSANSVIVIDSLNDLTDAEDLIRYKDLIKSKFSLIGANIKTQDGRKLGKVKDFTIDSHSYKTSKLHASASLTKRLFNERYIIDISNVIEVKGKTIIVNNTNIKSKQKYTKALPAQSS